MAAQRPRDAAVAMKTTLQLATALCAKTFYVHLVLKLINA